MTVRYKNEVNESASFIAEHCNGCKKCLRECIMLKDYTDCPGNLFKKFISTQEIEPIIPYSCNLCNQCTLVCPKQLRLSEVFVLMRQDLVEANMGKSPIKGHRAIDMHQMLSFSKWFTTKQKGVKE